MENIGTTLWLLMITSSTFFLWGPTAGIIMFSHKEYKPKEHVLAGFAISLLLNIFIGLFFADTFIGK